MLSMKSATTCVGNLLEDASFPNCRFQLVCVSYWAGVPSTTPIQSTLLHCCTQRSSKQEQSRCHTSSRNLYGCCSHSQRAKQGDVWSPVSPITPDVLLLWEKGTKCKPHHRIELWPLSMKSYIVEKCIIFCSTNVELWSKNIRAEDWGKKALITRAI